MKKQDGTDHRLMLDAVREAGACALARFRTEQKVWRKSKYHPVCEADIETNTVLSRMLKDERPSYGWLSEESDDNDARLTAERIWVVDPIDGTNSYLKGLPEFAVSVALIADGRALMGAVYNPAANEMFEAVAGDGARLNGETISVSDCAEIADASILASRSERREAGWPERFSAENVHAISSIAYKLAMIAEGRYDATASAWPKADWDICAGCLLVAEAGGTITSIAGKDLRFNKEQPKHETCLASNGYLHEALKSELGKWAEK
ncbi:MAG: 3'(2'),5'-bisphosphate nucleotidase CysQ [Rhodospirillaceae bacterium]|nr:3'(2'),5'-bisphosphate nucleotidase CysQ [Rhodospirillaceae bacterium]|tara:strand:+ start:774 stop:1568 length:795 start_codon:yes stop_codon:yes gene_type:complete